MIADNFAEEMSSSTFHYVNIASTVSFSFLDSIPLAEVDFRYKPIAGVSVNSRRSGIPEVLLAASGRRRKNGLSGRSPEKEIR